MNRFVAALGLAIALTLPTAATGIGLVNPVEQYQTSVEVAKFMAANEACDEAFQDLYGKKKKRPMLDLLGEIYIAVVEIPDSATGFGALGLTIPQVAPRILMLDSFWLTVRSPVDTAETILHEVVHLLDFSYLPTEEWLSLSPSEREVRAEVVTDICKAAFYENYPELKIGD